MPEHDSWEQLAGYFDADGTMSFSDTTNQPYKLSISLILVDQSEDQIRTVRDFLHNQGVRTGNILKTSKKTAHMLAVSEFNAVKHVLKFMGPLLYKKANEAQAALDHYEGRITGNELFSVFQKEVEAGRRERRERRVPIDVPYRYPEGDRLMKQIRSIRLKDAFGRFRAKVTPQDFQNIREEFFKGKSMKELRRAYPQYSRTTIRRILGKLQGYFMVVGEGMVATGRAVGTKDGGASAGTSPRT